MQAGFLPRPVSVRIAGGSPRRGRWTAPALLRQAMQVRVLPAAPVNAPLMGTGRPPVLKIPGYLGSSPGGRTKRASQANLVEALA